MESEYARLLSFCEWAEKPPGDFSSAVFAAAGLYLDRLGRSAGREGVGGGKGGDGDERTTPRVTCAFCGIQFDCSGDAGSRLVRNPLREHIRRNPLCPFTRGRSDCGDAPLHEGDLHPSVNDDANFEYVRLRSFERSGRDLTERCLAERQRLAKSALYCDRRSETVRSAFCDSSVSSKAGTESPSHDSSGSNVAAVSDPPDGELFDSHDDFPHPSLLGNVPLGETDSPSVGVPSHPRMEDFERRLSTYADWPSSDRPSKLALAECGFYYTGVADCTTCHWCGVTVGNWEACDVPRVEHFLHCPECLLAVRMLKERNSPSLRKKGDDGKSTPDPASERRVDELQNDETRERRDVSSDDMTCVVCMDRKRNVLYVSCGHFLTCEKCSLSISNCPVCRSPIAEKIKVYT